MIKIRSKYYLIFIFMCRKTGQRINILYNEMTNDPHLDSTNIFHFNIPFVENIFFLLVISTLIDRASKVKVVNKRCGRKDPCQR